MKKILFAAYNLDLGGIETALVTLLNYLAKKNEYRITLALEKKEGMFLNEIDSKINLIEYRPSENKILPIRKMLNLFKRLKFILKYKNKFDFSASFATYSLASGFIARVASKNNALWVHADYLSLAEGDKNKVKFFFENVHHDKYNNVIFVSNEARNSYLSAFPQRKNACIVINNIIDYESIREKSLEQISIGRDTTRVTFLNAGRHFEKQKKLSRLIEAASKLKQDGLNFRILLVGDGPDTDYYKKMVMDYNLQKYVIFAGRQKNPYPYFKISDCLVLTSDYEGYPVVFIESMLLGLPIITTNVSDSAEEIDGKFGYVTNKTTDDIYICMKRFLQGGFVQPKRFDPVDFNETQTKKLESIL